MVLLVCTCIYVKSLVTQAFDRVLFGSFFQDMNSAGSSSDGEHLAVGMDVADSLSVEDGFRKAVKHFGGDPPAIVVNSAGTTNIIKEYPQACFLYTFWRPSRPNRAHTLEFFFKSLSFFFPKSERFLI